jgi:hypothetical protein
MVNGPKRPCSNNERLCGDAPTINLQEIEEHFRKSRKCVLPDESRNTFKDILIKHGITGILGDGPKNTNESLEECFVFRNKIYASR